MSRHTPPLLPPAVRHRTALPLLAILGLIAWLAPPLAADVIDDFNGPPKWDVIEDPTGVLDYEVVAGELSMSHPKGSTGRLMDYFRTYAVPEDRWIELRLDVVGASSETGGMIAFVMRVPGGVTSYWLARVDDMIFLTKGWPDGNTWFIGEPALPSSTGPVTLMLGLRRQGTDMMLETNVVDRDNPDLVLCQKSFTDHAGEDPVVAGVPGLDRDLAPPVLGPSAVVIAAMGDTGQSGPSVLVIDNFVCSEDPVAVALGIRREGDNQIALNWQGAYVPFAAASPQGPWEPCPELITDGESGSSLAMALSGSSKFFRLVRGWNAGMFFEAGKTRPAWRTKAMGIGSPPLRYTYPEGHLRLTVTGDIVRDFAFYDGNAISWWPKDCVGSVDILGWDPALEGQKFGLMLRVKPDQDVWYISKGVPEQRYSGLLTFKRTENPAESELAILGPGGAPLGTTRFAAVDPAKQYRLRFSAVGDQLKLQLFDLARPEAAIQSCAATDGRVSAGMVAFQGTMSADGKYDVTIDRFILNGSMR